MPAVEVTNVFQVPAAESGLLGGAIDRPRIGSSSDGHAFEIEGWALGAEKRVDAIEIINQDQVIQSFRLLVPRKDISALFPQSPWGLGSGFVGLVSTLALEPEFRLLLAARFVDNSAAPLAVINGRCAPIRTEYVPRFQPLVVTSGGRSGTTAMMNLLAHIRGVACERRYPLELRIAKYWLHLLTVIGSAADDRFSVNRAGFAHSPFAAGRNPFHDPAETSLRPWLESEHVLNAARFVQQQIDQAYTVLATDPPEPTGPRYFAEKTIPDRFVWLLHRLYDEPREIFLVRDPRDVYCSVKAFDAKRGYKGFGGSEDEGEVQVLHRMLEGTKEFHATWEARRSTALLIKYEDLISNELGVVGTVCDYLSLGGGPNEPAEIVRRAEANQDYLSEHRTTATLNESIGRWRIDLPAELRDECASFDDVLALFGYEPTS